MKLRASIRDTGVGVAHDKLEKIFEAFQQADGFNTRKYEGSGLGLTICKQISHLLGGDVTAQSTLGEGSVFHFTAWFERAGVRKKSDVAPMLSLAGTRVLVADDNANNLEILKHILSQAGVRVTAVAEPGDVLPALLDAYALEDPYSLAIIDICMPDVSGYEVAGQIRGQNSGIAEMALLAYSSSVGHGSSSCIEAGFNGFLVKPASRKKLMEMVGAIDRDQTASRRQESSSTPSFLNLLPAQAATMDYESSLQKTTPPTSSSQPSCSLKQGLEWMRPGMDTKRWRSIPAPPKFSI